MKKEKKGVQCTKANEITKRGKREADSLESRPCLYRWVMRHSEKHKQKFVYDSKLQAACSEKMSSLLICDDVEVAAMMK